MPPASRNIIFFFLREPIRSAVDRRYTIKAVDISATGRAVFGSVPYPPIIPKSWKKTQINSDAATVTHAAILLDRIHKAEMIRNAATMAAFHTSGFASRAVEKTEIVC